MEEEKRKGCSGKDSLKEKADRNLEASPGCRRECSVVHAVQVYRHPGGRKDEVKTDSSYYIDR